MTAETELAEQGWMTGEELSRRGWQALERARQLNTLSGTGLTGITSGLRLLDFATSGWQPGDLIVVAGRPGIGKTGLALHMAIAAAQRGVEVAFMSMEMPPTSCWTRVVAALGPQDERPLRSGFANAEQYGKVAATIERFREFPTVWKDGSRLTVEEITQQARWLQSRELCRLLVVDQLGNVIPAATRENRVSQVSAIAGGLKAMAQTLGIPVIATHQLNRESEHAGQERRPQLWHLRDSGAVEQEADVVLLLHRTWVPTPERFSGPVEVQVAKNRRGMMPTLSYTYTATQTRFEDGPWQL